MSELDYYWDLSSKDPELREQSSLKIIESVRLTIPKNIEKIDHDDSESILQSILGENGFYALKRLIKGLSSSREHSRLGFSMTLSEFLHEFENIDVEDVVKLIEKYTMIQKSFSSQEERDYLFGRLFGLKAISLSKILLRTESIKKIENVINLLISLSLKKGWLREPCFFIINNILVQFQGHCRFKEISSVILRKVCDAKMSKTPEGVAVILTIQKNTKDLKSIGDTQWNPLSPFDSSNLEDLIKVLKDININPETKQRGNWNAKLHFVWDIIIEIYTSKTNDIVNLPFLNFWTKVIDESFFSATSSLERKFWGFQIFNLILSKIEISNIPCMFSKNFMRCFINHLSNEDRYLNKISNKVLSCIISVANTRKEVILPIIKSLLGPFGALNFDKITKTKLVESLISLADEECLWDILQLLKEITCSPYSKDIKDIEKRQKTSIDMMLNILRNKKYSKTNDWITEYIDFFLIYGYFESKSNSECLFSTNIKTILRSRLLSSLTYLNFQSQSIKSYEDLQKQTFWPSIVVTKIISLSESRKYDLSVNMDPKTSKIRDKSIKIFKKILKKKSNSKEEVARKFFIFELLYSLSILQLYNGDLKIIPVLKELKICYNDFFKKKTESESKEDAIEVLTDILLGFLSEQSALFRKLVEQAFTYFVYEINDKCLSLLVNILETNENSSKNTLFQEIASDDNYDNTEDHKLMNGNNKNSAEDSDEDIIENFSEIENIKTDNELENAVENVLSIPNKDVGNNSEESMDDEQMFELDKHITNILKQKKERNKKNINIKNNIIEFKNKVLDILDIFLKIRSQEPIILKLIMPLLTLIRTTSSDIISNKARNLIGNRLCKAKIDLYNVNIDVIFDILKQIHKDGLKIKKNVIGTAHSQCSIFLVKMIISKDINLMTRILEVYSDTFNNWITKKRIKLHASLFTDLVNWGNQFRHENKKVDKKH
ncbi:hypothetical protein PORY_001954 [Pneumocystis oryctolagi]|uniref:Uncharacterized protein n=1 Tax=Pneumocystis oryctolagi TaxID=42067 RepID=A0ACB7CA13_9ASCO|nr:hypothetical protein PORY_001954 [Pneumocystis oryctolagi]